MRLLYICERRGLRDLNVPRNGPISGSSHFSVTRFESDRVQYSLIPGQTGPGLYFILYPHAGPGLIINISLSVPVLTLLWRFEPGEAWSSFLPGWSRTFIYSACLGHYWLGLSFFGSDCVRALLFYRWFGQSRDSSSVFMGLSFSVDSFGALIDFFFPGGTGPRLHSFQNSSPDLNRTKILIVMHRHIKKSVKYGPGQQFQQKIQTILIF